jgi:hypothetical protein
VVVTGSSSTIKYAAADGARLWEQRYTNGSGRVVAVDGNDHVVVAGSSFNGTNYDYYTAKYATVDGGLLWEQRYNGPSNRFDCARAVAVDGSDNVVVTGVSFNASRDGEARDGDYHTLRYAAADGALLWEKRYRGGPVQVDDLDEASPSLAVRHDGTVVITGSSRGEFDYNYVTIVYRENLAPVITCPPNAVASATHSTGAVIKFTVTAVDDSGVSSAITCVPFSGSMFPIGQTAVTCTATDGEMSSSTCSFTVTVFSARTAMENLLAELIALRTVVTNRNEAGKLDAAIKHLTRSLAAKLWLDETHLDRKHGTRVFHQKKLVARKLCRFLESHIPLPFLPRNFPVEAERLLAVVAIEDAMAAGLSSKRIEKAQRFLARGDAAAADAQCFNGIEEYRRAWQRATRARSQ